MRDIGQALAGLTDPGRVEEIMNFVELALAEVAANKSKRPGDAKSISDKAWEFTGEVFETGMEWFDKHAGGFWTGRITWFPARYKGGKSTLMRNIVLHMLRSGVPCEVFLAEGSQEQFARDIQVMIAVDLMFQSGMSPRDIVLSADRVALSILHKRADIKPKYPVVLTQQEKDALKMARQEFETFPLRAWDVQDGIDDLITAAYVTKQGKMEQGTKVVFFDYAQLFRVRGTQGIYESATANAIFLQKLAAKENVSVVVLAQKNEAGVRQTGKENDEYTDNVSGGGAAGATADYTIVPEIIPQENDIISIMKTRLTRSRHTRPAFGVHSIHPGSGMFVDDHFTFTKEDLLAAADKASEGGEDEFYTFMDF
jgi:hypothetical protein